jgi:hypothetical protein
LPACMRPCGAGVADLDSLSRPARDAEPWSARD